MRSWFRIGAWLAAAGVLCGAFGAHALKGRFDTTIWETGARYHLFAATALMASGAAGVTRGNALLCAGALIFSGSLYLLCLTEIRWLGAITPLGGLLMIAGLLRMGWAAR